MSGKRLMNLTVGISILMICIAMPLAWSQTLRIYHIDVEQADATLFVSPSGRTMLVDSGKNRHGGRIKAVMDAAGVAQIDVFVNTHYHEDHYGGIDDLVRDFNVPVLEAYDRGDKDYLPESRTSGTTYIDYNNTVGEDAIHLIRDSTIPFDPLLTVTCISSGGVVIGEDNPVAGRDENDMSVSLLVTYGQFTYFVGGDIEEATETKIAERDLVVDVDVYQSNHHGSSTSSSRPFMEDLGPTVIIISNGSHGRYFHPRQTTLDLYSSLPDSPVVFQTNKCLKGSPCGNVPDNRIGDPETSDEDGTVLIEVDNAAGTYTVSLGDSVYNIYQIKSVDSNVLLVIESLLPNPKGSDTRLEEVSINNKGNQTVSLVGWVLRDRSNREWELSSLGSVAPGQSRTIRRNGQPMSLNNTGDEITLLDAGNVVRDRFKYSSSSKGVVISTGH